MPYKVTSQDKTVLFYGINSEFLSKVDLGKKRLTKTVKESESRAIFIKVIDSLVKHDNYGVHINNYTRIREYRRCDSGKLYLSKDVTRQDY